MKFASMRSEPGEAPVIIAEPEKGDVIREGDAVEAGTGVVAIVSPGSVAIRALVEVDAEGRQLGYPLARRCRYAATLLPHRPATATSKAYPFLVLSEKPALAPKVEPESLAPVIEEAPTRKTKKGD